MTMAERKTRKDEAEAPAPTGRVTPPHSMPIRPHTDPKTAAANADVHIGAYPQGTNQDAGGLAPEAAVEESVQVARRVAEAQRVNAANPDAPHEGQLATQADTYGDAARRRAGMSDDEIRDAQAERQAHAKGERNA